MNFAKHLCVVIAAASVLCVAAQAENWPGFRGPDGTGVSATPIAEKWSTTENVLWKTDIAGRGWSSPVVWGDKLFLTTVVSHGEVEAAKKGLYFGGERAKASEAEHDWKVLCLELGSGKTLWEKVVHTGKPPQSIHVKNSYASETPVTDGKYLYACFGGVGIFALDFAGNDVWKFELPPVTMRFNWGTAAGPALHDGKLYYVSDNEDASYILALDAATGKELWRTPRDDEKSNWSPPFVWTHDGKTEIVTAGSKGNRSYDTSGKLLWSLKGMSSITIAMPYAADGLLYVTSGYVGDKMKPVYAIKPGASGDITLAEGATSNDFIAWSNTGIGPYNPSTLVYGGLFYVLYDRGMISCFDAKTGAVKYEKQKLEGSAGFTASPWAAGGKIYCGDENGQTFVLKAGHTFELLGMNALAEDDMIMATPATVDGKLVLRTAERVYCIVPKKQSQQSSYSYNSALSSSSIFERAETADASSGSGGGYGSSLPRWSR